MTVYHRFNHLRRAKGAIIIRGTNALFGEKETA